MAMGKKACMIVTLMLLPLAIMSVIHAQNIPKPSCARICLFSVSHSPFTGSTSTKLVINGIQINITNQPYTYSFNGTTYVLYYDYRYKAHSAQNWEQSPYTQNNSYPPQSNSNTTILSIPEISLPQPPGDVQIDFQVQAIAGHHQTETGTFIFPDETSDWSPTQTINFPRPTMHTDSPPPSTSPTIPEFSGWIILPLLTITGLLIYLTNTSNRNWKK
ncbi:MAG: hypothetical protein NWF00_08630 [Candidatus Bathyarchaeota archaeon]|nr:hypothetical protein [Candidatus Bathyarchaeota archaeon]